MKAALSEASCVNRVTFSWIFPCCSNDIRKNSKVHNHSVKTTVNHNFRFRGIMAGGLGTGSYLGLAE